MTFIITVNGSIKQSTESVPNLSILPKPLSFILDARALEFQDDDFATEIIASGTWDIRLRTLRNIMQSEISKTAPIFKKSDGFSGNPCLRFLGTNNIRSDILETKSNQVAIASLIKVNRYDRNSRVAYLGSTATNRRGIQTGTTGVSAIYGNTSLNSGVLDYQWVVQIAYFDNENSKLIIDDKIFNGPLSGIESFNCITLGGDNTGATSLEGDISYIAVYEGELTETQLINWAKEIKLMFS